MWVIKDKVVVVTGAADGIGFHIANHFAKNGAKVVIILDINEKLGETAVTKITDNFGKGKAVFIKCDVTKDRESVYKKIIDTYDYVDVLVNNAGILNEALIKKTMEVNSIAVIEWAMLYWEHMRKDKGGKGGTIINISSIYGYRINEFSPIYQASKFAVLGYTRSWGHKYHFERTGVRMFAICPGLSETSMLTNNANLYDTTTFDAFLEYTKKEKVQKPEELGRGTIEAYFKAESGTAWLVEAAEPAVEIKF